MSRVMLLHWKKSELVEKASILEKAGYVVDPHFAIDAQALRDARKNVPAAFVIDLSRLPSHGRIVGIVFRDSKATRNVPLVFVGGEEEKIDRVRQALPDATFCSWRGIAPALKKAIANPPKKPVVFKSTSGGYSGTPLPKKLGVDGDKSVLLMEAPEGFEAKIGVAKGDKRVRRGGRGKADVVILFVGSRAEYQKKLPGAINSMEEGGGLWAAWPKKSSGVKTDIDENFIRDLGLESGIVDYKVCAIDEMWSGLKFARRRAK